MYGFERPMALSYRSGKSRGVLGDHEPLWLLAFIGSVARNLGFLLVLQRGHSARAFLLRFYRFIVFRTLLSSEIGLSIDCICGRA